LRISRISKANTNPDGSTDFSEKGLLRLNYQPALNTRDTVYLKVCCKSKVITAIPFNVYLLYLQANIPAIEAPSYLKKYKY
jgi:hypothetical protein